ncbi:hypothetical protein KC343_g2956 [Hortaea werneckii]|nr:hypothetical protein KC352_g8756 [Hortaea werneckii]KAI7570594.1 hypothetical protein KC317_g2326 [Hortaea werneckii]KAI7624684.1 hypothetical protein KC346_g2110 [Hortaea werneckii]KAI7633424.1 hypothetical protein KC343_g2956 [Hortaea werneckii]KAI7678471.1 hypothetical protein KC319_g3331 [Hortaea werneckii]
MQDIGDRTLLEIESEPFCAAVEERQTPQMPSQVLLPKQFTKLGTSGPAWDVVPYQSSSHSPDRVQQELKCLLQPQPTGDKRDAGCLSMIYVIYLPELDRFKIGSVKQRRLKGELESAASFREEGCMRRMARIKKECGYRRIELGYQSEPLETCLIRRLERFVHRALSSVADKICCLKTKPKHNHVGFFDAEFRVIRDIVEKSLALIQEGVWDGSQCSSLSKSNLKANDFLRDVKPGKGKHNVETASPESEHPINILNHFCTALRPGSTHHPIYHPAQLSSEDQHRILLILDNHRHQHKRTEVRSGNLIDEAEDGKTDEQIFGLITLVEDAPALHDWKVLSRSKGHEADDLTWEPLVNLLPGSLDEILDFIAGCLLQSRSHDKLVRYLRLHQQLSQLR